MTILGINEGAVLMLVSSASLSMLCLLCLKCKKKSKIIQQESSIYDPQIFQREGSRFAVTRSKTVTRPNQMKTQNQEYVCNMSSAPLTYKNGFVKLYAFNLTQTYVIFRETEARHSHISQSANEDYTFVIGDQEGFEATYVSPLPIAVYGNIEEIKQAASASNLCDYENILTASSINDDEDYENSEFLKNIEDLTDDPDYVNTQQGAC
ncbi:uncharacterized protein LOC130385859 isoform X1 [Gadus chalcogrammus]|uniref:uncharacterized protein LOC130385859 isoform X1 n=1 Tax=Gadus chalcogrammus TaxID=1042646 RepID=UPI0024C45B25|nr:uncharacterized protein LOC130385859 isoform X1 [Gadus chalcogrammus]XP_056450568.1 uncharacterized protein LOC130385859 isoform X1 [Gadus chalcogrammus]